MKDWEILVLLILLIPVSFAQDANISNLNIIILNNTSSAQTEPDFYECIDCHKTTQIVNENKPDWMVMTNGLEEINKSSWIAEINECMNCHTLHQLKEDKITNTPIRFTLIHSLAEWISLIISIIGALIVIMGIPHSIKKCIKDVDNNQNRYCELELIILVIIIAIFIALLIPVFTNIKIPTFIIAFLIVAISFSIYFYLIKIFQILEKKRNKLRFELAHWTLLGLQFLIAAEVISSIIVPDWNKLGLLSVTIAIRLIMGYFMEREEEIR